MTDRASVRFPVFATQLVALAAADQAMREAYLAGSGPWDDASDARGADALRNIVAEIGWPTVVKVGRAGTDAAWILAQHADHDLAFQKSCLDLMRACAADEIPAEHVAYLEDRIAVSEGRPQAYGTQWTPGADGVMLPFPVVDPENLEARRRAVGLGPSDAARLETSAQRKGWSFPADAANGGRAAQGRRGLVVLDSVQAVLAEVAARTDAPSLELAISDALQDPAGWNMAVILNGLLARGFWPAGNGFRQYPGYRVYAYVRTEK